MPHTVNLCVGSVLLFLLLIKTSLSNIRFIEPKAKVSAVMNS